LAELWEPAPRTTHTHEHPRIPGYDFFKDVGHWDCKRIKAGESWEFPLMEGPGCVTAMWMTFAGRLHEVMLRRNIPAHRFLWINVYYDGADEPAISTPVGHFFGNGTTRYVHFDSRFVGMTSGGYYCFLPMPFKKSCRVVMENRHKSRHLPLFFGMITYHQLPELPDDMGYLHTQYNARTYKNSKDVSGSQVPNDPHLILSEDRGPGVYVGQNLTIFPTSIKSRFKAPYFLFPYLEGNHKVYVDDEVGEIGPDTVDKPIGAPYGKQSIECTGVEDYFLSGWYYIKGPFGGLYNGCPVRSQLTGAVTQYRFHEYDPYPWNDRIRMTVTHGEFDQVDCKMESLAYYYLKR
jgi:hypothetical protein